MNSKRIMEGKEMPKAAPRRKARREMPARDVGSDGLAVVGGEEGGGGGEGGGGNAGRGLFLLRSLSASASLLACPV